MRKANTIAMVAAGDNDNVIVIEMAIRGYLSSILVNKLKFLKLMVGV